MIHLLLLTLMACLFLAVVVSEGDWMSPAPLCALAFTLSVACAVYNAAVWKIDLHDEAFWTISGGVALFVLSSSFIAGALNTRDARNGGSRGRRHGYVAQAPKELRLKPVVVLIATVCCIGVVTLYASAMARVFARIGAGGDWGQAIGVYRLATANVYDAAAVKLPTYVTYAYLAMMALAYVVLFIVINNLVVDRRLTKRTAAYLPIIVLYLGSTIMRAGRFPLLEFGSAAVVMHWILWHRTYGWRRPLRIGYLALVLVLILGGIFAFSGLRELVGRTSSQDAVGYVTQYGGGSIELFDQFLQSPPAPSGLWGKETFRSSISLLGRLAGIEDFAYSYQLEFRSAQGVIIGNVYTAFRYWIYDFGYTGWALILAFYSVFYSVLYHRVKYGSEHQAFDYVLVVYAYLATGLVMLPIQDMLLAQYLNLGTIFMLICIGFFGWFLIERPKS